MHKKNRKIVHIDICKALFSETLLLECSSPYFEPAIGHFEIWEKNTLRRMSDMDFISRPKEKYGQVPLKVGDLSIDETVVFQKSTFRSMWNGCFIKITDFSDGGLKIPLFGKLLKNII